MQTLSVYPRVCVCRHRWGINVRVNAGRVCVKSETGREGLPRDADLALRPGLGRVRS